jgi:hypothetical protein
VSFNDRILLFREFDEVLKVLKWPFTSGSTAPSLAANSNVFQTLESLFLLLLQVSEMYPFASYKPAC